MAGRSLRAADLRYGGGKFQPAPKLTDYSTSQLNTLLKTLNNPTFKAPPKFDSQFGSGDSANTSGMTVLAVLAHELGHVRWYDWLEPVPSPVHKTVDLTLLINCTPDRSLFFQGSWRATPQPNEAFAVRQLWLPFGQTADPNLVNHASGPPISDFTGQRRPEGTAPNAETYQRRHRDDQPLVALAANLNELYSDNNPWASLLGSLSPTEDLVETYTLSALTQASPPLRSLRLNIASPDRQIFQQDVVADLPNKPGLARKLACLSTLNDAYP
jgi:hypothetical protein